MDLNNVTLIGRLTRDCEIRYTSGGLAICEFSVAVNRRKKEGDVWIDEPNFFSITLFGRQGEAIQRYLIKGKQVGVHGELRQDRWEQDGQKRSKVLIVANNVQLLGGSSGKSEHSTSAPAGADVESSSPASGKEFEDDIPF